MENVSVANFIIDLKISPSKGPLILELGALQVSGLTGLRVDHGDPEKWVQNTVYQFIEDLGLQIHQSGGLGYSTKKSIAQNLGLSPVHMQAHFDPDDISTYAGVILKSGLLKDEERVFLQQDMQGQLIASDQNRLCKAAFNNKAAFYALAHDVIGHILPKQGLYAVVDGKVDTGLIRGDFEGHSDVVLKQPENARAEGVDIATLDRLEKRFLADHGKKRKLRARFSMARDDTLVVQELIRGKAVKAKLNGQENEYDPVVRVIATAYRSNGRSHVKCHEAYYKFPQKPVSDNLSRKSIISKVQGDGPRGRVLDDEDKAELFDKLEGDLPAFFEKVFTSNPKVIVEDMLSSDNEGMQKAGVEIATDNFYFDRWNADTLQEDPFPDDLAEKIFAMQDSSSKVQGLLKKKHGWNDGSLGRKLLNLAHQNPNTQKKAISIPQIFQNLKEAAKAFTPVVIIGGLLSGLVYLVYDEIQENRQMRRDFVELFNAENLGLNDYPNASLQTAEIDFTAKSVTGLFHDVLRDSNLTSCLTISPISQDSAQSLSEYFAHENTSVDFYGVQLEDTFRLYAETCPDTELPIALPMEDIVDFAPQTFE